MKRDLTWWQFVLVVVAVSGAVVAHDALGQESRAPEQKPLTEQQARERTLQMQRDNANNDVVNVNAALLMALEKIKELEARAKSCAPDDKAKPPATP